MSFIKEDYVLGNKKIVVGDNLHDLVLENLGKIWVRYGNGYKEFSQFVSTLAKSVTSTSKVIIEPDGLLSPDYYKSGLLIFDARKKNLYLKFEESLLLLLEYNDDVIEKYVAKAGDTMTGMLSIEVLNGPPLKVNSAELIKNLNANYLEGKKADDFAQKAKNETITGNWTFQGKNVHNGLNTFNNKVIINGELEENSTSKFAGKATFNNEIEVAKTATFKLAGGTAIRVGTGDIVTDGSIGSSQFMSGMTGYGWRLDANTNTLTIDNLIVRGVLNVFELVVNKISATNGSFWITDSFKIDTVHEIEYLNMDTLLVTDDESYSSLINKFLEDKYFVIYGNNYNKYTITPDLSEHPFATRNNQSPTVESLTFDKFKWMFKINNLNNFKSIFDPIVVEDSIETQEVTIELNDLVNAELERFSSVEIDILDNDIILNHVNEENQIVSNLSRIIIGEDKGYLFIDENDIVHIIVDGLVQQFMADNPTAKYINVEFLQHNGNNTKRFYTDVTIPGSTTYKDLTIITDSQLISLNNDGTITLVNMFLKNPEKVSDMDILDEDHLINPWAESLFESCKFTIVDASQATLGDDGIYIYDDSAISRINLYCKYFGSTLNSSGIGDSNMRTWVLECKHDEFPVFKPGDILKCQKFEGNNIKQYHALVLGLADSYSCIVLLLNYSVIQEGTTLRYDIDGTLSDSLINIDTTLYDRSLGLLYDLKNYADRAREILNDYANDITSLTNDSINWAILVLINPNDITNYTIPDNPTQEQAATWVNTIIDNQIDGLSYEECLEHPIFKKAFEKSVLNAPEKDDALVRIGSIFFSDRRNSMYLTSSEQNSPYTDVLVGVNRPDYTVVYLTPKYVKFEATNTNRKGQYYLQSDEFGELIENGNAGQLTGDDLIKYNKFKDFSIKLDMIEGGETNFQKTFVKLTFLPNENTLHNLDGSLMTLDVDGITYYVSSTNANIISNELAFNDVESGTFVLDSQNTIHLTIGG